MGRAPILFAEIDGNCRLKLSPEVAPRFRELFAEAFATTLDLMLVKVFPLAAWEDRVRALKSEIAHPEASRRVLWLAERYGGRTAVDSEGVLQLPPQLCARLSLVNAQAVPLFYSAGPRPVLELMTNEFWKDLCHLRCKDMEARLRSRLQAEQKRYQHACAEEKFALELIADLDPNQPDRESRLHQAIAAQNEALQAYRKALQEWTQFVVDGRIPKWVAPSGPPSQREPRQDRKATESIR